MFAYNTTEVESAQKRWCQSGVQCLSFYPVSHLCEMSWHRSSHGAHTVSDHRNVNAELQAGFDLHGITGWGIKQGGVFLKVISTTYEKTAFHIPCICETVYQEWRMSTFWGKLQVVFHVWIWCFKKNVFLKEFSILNTCSFYVVVDNI